MQVIKIKRIRTHKSFPSDSLGHWPQLCFLDVLRLAAFSYGASQMEGKHLFSKNTIACTFPHSNISDSRHSMNFKLSWSLINHKDWWSHQLNPMIMMINCFCGMVDQRKAFILISSWDHCQRSPICRELCWIKLWSNDNHYTTAPWLVNTLPIFIDISLQIGKIVISNKKIKESN